MKIYVNFSGLSFHFSDDLWMSNEAVQINMQSKFKKLLIYWKKKLGILATHKKMKYETYLSTPRLVGQVLFFIIIFDWCCTSFYIFRIKKIGRTPTDLYHTNIALLFYYLLQISLGILYKIHSFGKMRQINVCSGLSNIFGIYLIAYNIIDSYDARL